MRNTNQTQMKWKWIISLLLLLVLTMVTAMPHATSNYNHVKSMGPIKLMGARLSQNGDQTRLVFEFSKAFQYRLSTLTHPHRFIVDLKGAVLATDLAHLPLDHSAIQSIRHSVHVQNTLRIVFDIEKRVKVKSFILKPYDQYGDRLVLDMTTSQEKITHLKKPPPKSSG